MLAIYGEVCKKNLKIFLLPAALSALIVVICLLFITDLRNCSPAFAANICQKFFALTGILLLSPVFTPEQKDNTEETLLAKVIPLKIVYMIRLVSALATLALFTAGFLGLLVILGGDIEFTRYFTHTYATALFLGSLGFAAAKFTGNIGVSYIVAFGFYIVQAFFPIEITRYFYLFTLRSDEYYIVPIYVCALILIVSPVLISIKVSPFRLSWNKSRRSLND